jgi:hypothetical protein
MAKVKTMEEQRFAMERCNAMKDAAIERRLVEIRAERGVRAVI